MKYLRCIALCAAILFSIFLIMLSEIREPYYNNGYENALAFAPLLLIAAILLMAGLMIIPSVHFGYKIAMFIVIVFAMHGFWTLMTDLYSYYVFLSQR